MYAEKRVGFCVRHSGFINDVSSVNDLFFECDFFDKPPPNRYKQTCAPSPPTRDHRRDSTKRVAAENSSL